eukprot:PRCOL_00002697-RA
MGVVAHLRGDEELVTAVALVPAGDVAFVTSRALTVKQYALNGTPAAEAAAASNNVSAAAQAAAKRDGAVLVRSWKPHPQPVAYMCTDRSGAHLATCSVDRSVRVWDAATGHCTHAFHGHGGTVLCALFDDAATTLYTCDEAGEVRAWDLRKRECRGVMRTHLSAATCLALGAGGALLASGGRDKVVAVWDTKSLQLKATIATDEAIEGVQMLDGTTALGRAAGAPAAGAAPASSTKRSKRTKAAATTAQQGADSAPSVVVSVGEDGYLRAWNVATCRKVFEQRADMGGSEGGIVALHHPRPGALLAATADSRLLTYEASASPGEGETMHLTGQLLGDAGEVIDATFVGGGGGGGGGDGGGDGLRVAVATNSAIVWLYDLIKKNEGCEAAAETAEAAAATGDTEGGAAAASTADEQTRPSSYMRAVGALAGHEETVLSLASSTQALASGDKEGAMRVWVGGCSTGSPGIGVSGGSGGMQCAGIAEAAHSGAVSALAFSRRAPAAFLVSGSADRTLKVWDLKPVRKVLEELEQDGSAQIEPVTLKSSAVVAAHDKDVNAVAVAPNDSMVASASQDRTVRLWRLPALVPAGTLRGHRRGVWSVEFSPTDRVVATASGDKTVRLWTIADCVCIRTLDGHTASVLRATFVTSGAQLLSTGSDGLLKLWDVASGECAATHEAHDDKAWALATPNGDTDGGYAVTGAGDGTLALWQDHTAAHAEEEANKEREAMLAEQQMSNAAYANDFATAVELALKLERPGKLRELLQDLLSKPGGKGEAQLETVVRGISDPKRLATLLSYCRDWNTNARFCHVAQATLRALLASRPPAEIASVPGAADLLAAIASYTERHMKRVGLLVQRSHLIDYTLKRLGQVDAGELNNDEDLGGDDGVIVFDAKGNVVKGVDPLAKDAVGAGRRRKAAKKKRKRPGVGVNYGSFDVAADAL